MEPHDFLQLSAANLLPPSGPQQGNLFASNSLELPNTSSTQSGSLSAPMEAGIAEEAMESVDYGQLLHDEVLDVFGGMTQVAAKIVDSNQSLQDEVVDVFAGMTDVTGKIVDYNQALLESELGSGTSDSPNPVIDSAVTSAQKQLESFAADEKFLEKMNQAFGEDWRPQAARALVYDLASGREIPKIEALPTTDLGGDGAFVGDTIYLAEEFLSENANDSEAVASVLLEELGHYVDKKLSSVDSPGDEGEIFAKLVQGETLSGAELAKLKGEDESTTIVLDGEEVPVELAEPEYPGYNLIYDPSAPEYDEDPEVVKLWQQRMVELGYDLGVDGYYGEESAAVATQFQEAKGLTVDGIVGEETWAATFSADVVESPGDIEYGDYDPVGGAPEFVTDEFLSKVFDISQGLDVVPEYLMAVMGFETGGSYDPAIQNADSAATGLIQFLESTAENLGTTTDELAGLTAVEQLDYVEQYFSGFRGSLSSLEDTYLAVLYPTAIGEDIVFEDGTEEYDANAGLDENSDGVVTPEETTTNVRGFLPGETLLLNIEPRAIPIA